MITDDVRALVRPLGAADDLDPLLERAAGARVVLLGEASHGTHEYYAWRAAVTRRLVAEHGFSFVAVEGDWPDCRTLGRSVTLAAGAPADPRTVLEAWGRWPQWMWANDEVARFTAWLRDYNTGLRLDDRIGFYGLDVYSLWESLRALIGYLREREPEHVEPALRAWRCFEPYREDPQGYALATRLAPESCEDAVVALLGDLRRRAHPTAGARERFDAEQNAAVVAGAERYYRTMVRGGTASWNLRDEHMADTLDRLLARHGDGAKGVVWAHNTHVGDARATDMAAAGMLNLGQLARERHGDRATLLVGFSGYAGEVVAADAWGAPPERMTVPPARAGSLEDLLHGLGQALLVFPTDHWPRWLREQRDHRAIGVVYHPGRERYGNYVPTVPGERYDALLHFDGTRALAPLAVPEPAAGERETEPWGR